MEWLANNWISVALLAAFVALHLFGHGHGHGRRAHQRAESDPRRGAGDDHGEHGAAGAPQNERRRRSGC